MRVDLLDQETSIEKAFLSPTCGWRSDGYRGVAKGISLDAGKDGNDGDVELF
jgi:hypothetical protein